MCGNLTCMFKRPTGQLDHEQQGLPHCAWWCGFVLQVATRQAYGTGLAKLGKANPQVVAMDGDTKNSTFTQKFKVRKTEHQDCGDYTLNDLDFIWSHMRPAAFLSYLSSTWAMCALLRNTCILISFEAYQFSLYKVGWHEWIHHLIDCYHYFLTDWQCWEF